MREVVGEGKLYKVLFLSGHCEAVHPHLSYLCKERLRIIPCSFTK